MSIYKFKVFNILLINIKSDDFKIIICKKVCFYRYYIDITTEGFIIRYDKDAPGQGCRFKRLILKLRT